MNKYRAYLSHAIRGKEGADCSADTQEKYCDAAIALANEIRLACPWLDLYVPAEHEDFVQKAYDGRFLSVEQILDIDCEIVDDCRMVIVYVPEGDELQGGRLVEYEHALDCCYPVAIFSNAAKAISFLTERYEYSKSFGGETWA